MSLLAQFLLRLSFGLAVGMAITSPKLVTSGYFRNHLYVTLGLTTLAALALSQVSATLAMWLAIAAAAASYVGSVCWLYESPRAGRLVLWLVAACSLAAALLAQPPLVTPNLTSFLQPFAVALSGLVLGVTFASMLLGHWYLNAPGMELAPLRRLLIVAAAAVGLQILLSGADLAAALSIGASIPLTSWLFLALRWTFGLIGVAMLLWMAWETLNVPNTQSATGILYVAVIGVFVGELAAELLSANSAFPV
jgi:hypothetical protein